MQQAVIHNPMSQHMMGAPKFYPEVGLLPKGKLASIPHSVRVVSLLFPIHRDHQCAKTFHHIIAITIRNKYCRA